MKYILWLCRVQMGESSDRNGRPLIVKNKSEQESGYTFCFMAFSASIFELIKKDVGCFNFAPLTHTHTSNHIFLK